MTVTVEYAEANLPELLEAVERGEKVTIFRDGKPVADLVPFEDLQKQKPRFGTGKGKKIILDPDWDKAIETQEELEAFLESAKGADARHQAEEELAGPLGGARDSAAVLREFLGSRF